MRKLPPDLRERLDADPFMHVCCITGSTSEKIDWHHNVIYAGRQLNEWWAILPLARSIHDRVHEQEIKDRCDWVMLNRASDSDLRPYCKAVNYIRRREILNKKYGSYPGRTNPNGDMRIPSSQRAPVLSHEQRADIR